MLWNFLYVQALLLAICDYLFTAPEHLVSQKGVCEREMFIVEHKHKLGAGRRKTRKLEQTGSRAGQGKERAGAILGPELEAFFKGERGPGHRGTAKLFLKQRETGQPYGKIEQ